MVRTGVGTWIVAMLVGAATPAPAWAGAQAATVPAGGGPAPVIHVPRSSGPIVLDGDLSDAAWQHAARVDTFYEYNPGDNLPPRVSTRAWLTYDTEALYVAVRCDDPDPESIRAPFVERDQVFGDQDNVALFLDTRGDRRVALQLRVNPRGVQSDAVNNDGYASGSEDFSPDFFYDTATRIDAAGWSAEFRIPLRSLRFDAHAAQSWNFFVVRNYPRDFRYQMASVTIPRGAGCLVCRAAALDGLQGLPASGGLVAAPHVTAMDKWGAATPGEPLRSGAADTEAGLDLKWTPSASTAVDLAVNPDFSQVETDVAQFSVNNRFALSYLEKRPFFLEAVDLLQTPMTAVYTRTITDPRWGARATGRLGTTAYTLLAADDAGGGVVVLPGPTGSGQANQDFRSHVGVLRARHELANSFVGLLATAREIEGGGYNRVIGPDFQWRPNASEAVVGQFLWSDTRTPRLSALASEWDGGRRQAHAVNLEWRHNTTKVDWRTTYADVGHEFRADLGFIPQVGYREFGVNFGYSFYRDRGLVTRTRTFLAVDVVDEPGGGVLRRFVQLGATVYGPRNLFVQPYIAYERTAWGGRLFDVTVGGLYATLNPAGWLPRLTLRGAVGEDVDFDNVRIGRALELTLNALLRSGPHLSLEVDSKLRQLDVRAGGRSYERLFTDQVQRLKLTFNFSSRAALRLIGQYHGIMRTPELYALADKERREAELGGSLLFTYRINWQTALYVGYGDTRAQDTIGRLRPATRELFVKLSYALQR